MNATPKETTELANCPFCGNDADVQNDFGRVFWAQCCDLDCGSTDGKEYDSPSDAIDAWNRRTAPSIPAQPGSGEAVRNAALEFAAQEIEHLRDTFDNEHNRSLGVAEDMMGIADDCADVVRSLKRATPAPADSAAERDARLTMQGMADCMDMVRGELIEAGIIDKTVPPMMISNAVFAKIGAVEREAARYRWLRIDRAESAIPRVWQSNESAEAVKCLHGDELDAEIDAAMRTNTGDKK